MNIYYVYYFLREDGSPYYVGKGHGDRMYHKNRKGCTRPDDKERIVKVKDNLTEQEALDLEVVLIKFWGRKQVDNTGILHNFTDGGDGVSGLKHSSITREKIKVNRSKQVFTPEVIARRNESISKGRRGVVVPYENKVSVRGRYE